MPSLERLKQKYQDKGLKILLINVGESKARVDSFMRRENYTFTVLLDSRGKVSEKYSVLAHPAAFLIDKKGKMVFRSIGYRDWNTKKNHAIFDTLIVE